MNSGVSFFLANSCRCRTTNIDRRAVGSKSPLLLRYDAFLLAVVTGAARDDFEEQFASVRHNGDATIVSALRPIFLLGGVLPVLRHAPSPPHSNDNFVDVSQIVLISFVDQDLQFNREAITSNRLAVRHRPDRFFHLIPRRDVV